VGLLHGRVGPHGLEKARLALLGRLSGRLGPGATEVTVVFDASGAPPGALPEQNYQGLHIRYALGGEADDLIEDLIRQDSAPQQLTIISDDHRIRDAARRRQCAVLGCLDYLDQVEHPRLPRHPPTEAPAKPDGVSAEEAERWLREFADLADDPRLRDELNPGFFEIDGD
jgi:hypothetical protein